MRENKYKWSGTFGGPARAYRVAALPTMHKLLAVLLLLAGYASATIVCDSNAAYRSYDGSCNNLDHTGWGVSFDQGPDGINDVFVRVNYTLIFGQPVGGVVVQIDAGNNDGIFVDDAALGREYASIVNRTSPRDAILNEAAAGVDLLSYPAFPPTPRVYTPANLLYTFIGQLVAHDVAETASPSIDPFVASPNRVVASPSGTFILGAATYDVIDPVDGLPRQFNNATAYLDLSFVYGPTQGVATALRSGVDGLLRTLGTKSFNYTATNVPNRDLCNCTLTLTNGTRVPYMAFDPFGYTAMPVLTSTTSGFTPDKNRIDTYPFNTAPFENVCYSSNPCGDKRIADFIPQCVNNSGKMLPVVIGCTNPATGAPAPFQPTALNVSCTYNVARANDGAHDTLFLTLTGGEVGNEWQPLASDVDGVVPTDKLLALTDDRREIPAAGDPRNVENFAILVLHNLFLREHNRKARELKAANGSMTDEELYQGARKWTIALWQKILHTEYVPYTVGQSAYAHSSLSKSYAQSGGYNATRDPRITNLFSASAFRFAHSMVPLALFPRHPNNMSRVAAGRQKQLYDHFFGINNPGPAINPWLNVPAAGQINGFALTFSHLAFMQAHLNASLNEKVDDAIMAALLVQQSQATDRYVENSIGNFQIPSCFTPFESISVSAIDVFRCRTHGCVNYELAREHFTGNSLYAVAPGCSALNATHDTAACFTALANGDAVYGAKLQQAYRKITNIDPFVGMIIEKESFADADAMVGKTASQIIVKEFEKMRASDRFWYEGAAVGLSTSERGRLNGRSFSKLIQDHHAALAGYLTSHDIGRKNVFAGTDACDPSGLSAAPIPEKKEKEKNGGHAK
jgi:hypothetical protein